jgi:murein DD-endopeptidase MepM/ murein hydrolase activator NlpD
MGIGFSVGSAMRLEVSAGHRRVLLRGAAVALVGGLAAGCSSDVSRFEQSLFTGSSRIQAQAAPVSQPYPGDAGGVDQTYTASVAQPASPNGIRARSGLNPMPTADVNSGGTMVAQAPQGVQQLPPPSSQGTYQMAAAQPAPALAPVSRSPLNGTTTSATASQPMPGGQSQTPLQAPNGQVAVLPSQPAQHTAAAAAAPAVGSTYTVVSGDTLHGISRRAGVSVDAIKRANGLSDGAIRIGQKLTIPAGGTIPQATTQVVAAPAQPAPAAQPAAQQVAAATPRVDTTTTSASQSTRVEQAQQVSAYTPPQRSAREIAALDTDDATAPDATGIGKMRWPVRGRVITAFGAADSGKPNDGIDISVPEGTSVRAAENGVVIYAGDGLKEFGNTVLVRHDDGLVTVYGHNSAIKVQRGATVRRGDEIALSGLSGSAATPKLHFEVRKDSTPVNPMTFLE